MVEYRCKDCGQIFIDDEATSTHFVKFDENDNQIDCGGQGEVLATFDRSSIPPMAG